MKSILKFNLPEESYEFNMALNGTSAHIILAEIDQWLRNKMKYDETLTEEAHAAYENCRERLHELLRENNITLN